MSIVNVVKSCSVGPKMPNRDAILSCPWNTFCDAFDETTTRLKFRHLSIIGDIRLAKLSAIPDELMLMVRIEFGW